MPFSPTLIDDLIVFKPRIFTDERGYFFESYNKSSFAEAGIECEFVQDNQSFSAYGTIRGIHLQTGQFSQAKLVRVLEGEVLDVAVDLRPSSSTFGNTFSIILSEENKRQLFIPRGFGHGFSVLSETAIFAYKCDNFYSKASEAGIAYNDPTLNIDWKIPQRDIIISKKDQELMTFKEFKRSVE